MESKKTNICVALICCGLPLLLVLFGIGSIAGWKWTIIAFIAIAIVGCHIMRDRENGGQARARQ